MSKLSFSSKDVNAAGMVNGMMATLPAAGGLSMAYNASTAKSQTILTGHLPLLTTGSLAINLTNNQTSLYSDEPLTGKIYLNMTEAFDARALKIHLLGYERATVEGLINKDKTVIDIEFTVATFEPGYVQTGASEFPFSLTLPKEVTESFLLQLAEPSLVFSKCFFLKAQMEPREDNSSQWADAAEKISLLRSDVALYLCKPQDERKPPTS